MARARVKVRNWTCMGNYDYGIYEGKIMLFQNNIRPWTWKREGAAIRNAKAMAKRIGIPYDPEIVKMHGC